jgi:ribosomal protein S18 acetylase RimI-like enzyme
MDNVIIELLNENDIKEYSELINEVMTEFNKEDLNGFQYWFASIEGITCRREFDFHEDGLGTVQFTAKYDGKIIGALEIENKCLIQSFFVKKEFQNQGIGNALLKYSLEFFEKNGIKEIEYNVFSSTYAINIYKSLGFEGEGNNLCFKNSK